MEAERANIDVIGAGSVWKKMIMEHANKNLTVWLICNCEWKKNTEEISIAFSSLTIDTREGFLYVCLFKRMLNWFEMLNAT